jgi:hypothetical protein
MDRDRGSASGVAWAGAGTLLLYLLFYYVPISTRHTVESFRLRPLGEWRIDSPGGLALFYALIIAGLFALYGLAFRKVRDAEAGERSRLRPIAYVVTGAAILILVFLPSLLTKDVFDYMVHGRILALHRANPYQVPASAFGIDEFYRAMGWPQYTAIYGPGWLSACAVISWLAPGSVAGSLVVYKLIFGGVHLATGLVIGALLRGWGRPSLAGELLFLWNPLVVTQAVAQAHNDGFVLLWALLGLLLIQRRASVRSFYDESLGVVCLCLSILVKYVTGPLLLFVLAARMRERGGLAGVARAAGLAAVGALVGLVGYLPYMQGIDFFSFLRPYSHGSYQGSSLMILHMILQKIVGEGGAAGERVADIMLSTGSGLALLTVLFVIVLAFRTRTEKDVPRHGLYLMLAYLLVVTALLRVSYGIWVVPLAVLVMPGFARGAALVFSASLMSLDVFWVYAIRSMESGVSLHREQAVATLVAVLAPISYLLAGVLHRRARAGRQGGEG